MYGQKLSHKFIPVKKIWLYDVPPSAKAYLKHLYLELVNLIYCDRPRETVFYPYAVTHLFVNKICLVKLWLVCFFHTTFQFWKRMGDNEAGDTTESHGK
jgi:hypothetical protein